jgi:hypothetical protein
MKKHHHLFIEDIDESLGADLVRKIKLGTSNVTHFDGWIIRADFHRDWRPIYKKWFQRIFPHAWIYTGGRHLAVHASPPANPNHHRNEPDGEAGRLLFRVIEIVRTVKLDCGRHFGPLPGPCWKCSSCFPQREIATARDRALISALSPA